MSPPSFSLSLPLAQHSNTRDDILPSVCIRPGQFTENCARTSPAHIGRLHRYDEPSLVSLLVNFSHAGNDNALASRVRGTEWKRVYIQWKRVTPSSWSVFESQCFSTRLYAKCPSMKMTQYCLIATPLSPTFPMTPTSTQSSTSSSQQVI